MKKSTFTLLLIIAIIAGLSVCALAENSFETEKIIKCADVLDSTMMSTKYDNSLGSYVYYSTGAFVSDSAEIKEPEMSFKFNVPEEGKYTIYVHGAFPTNGSDSFYFKFDDSHWKDVHPNAQGNELIWYTVETNYPLTAGEHSFHLHHRESGAYFDCFSIIKSDGDFKLIVEGETLETDVPPYIENGVSMVPFRALGEALGAEVSWNGEERSATIKTDKVSLTVVENSGEAYFGKFPIKLESPARIINGRFMVPVRFVANNLLYDVKWTSGTNHTFITKKQ